MSNHIEEAKLYHGKLSGTVFHLKRKYLEEIFVKSMQKIETQCVCD